MKRSDSRIGLLLVLLGVSACVVSAAIAAGLAAEPQDEAKALAKLDDEWSKVAASRDAKRVASFYAEDVVAYPPNEPLSTGRAAAEKVWAAYFADPSFSISWKTIHAEVSKSGELGFTSGTYQTSANGPDGKPATENGKYLCVWRKQKDGTWKAVHDMWNSDAR